MADAIAAMRGTQSSRLLRFPIKEGMVFPSRPSRSPTTRISCEPGVEKLKFDCIPAARAPTNVASNISQSSIVSFPKGFCPMDGKALANAANTRPKSSVLGLFSCVTVEPSAPKIALTKDRESSVAALCA